MEQVPILTVGYSLRTLDEFVSILAHYQVQYLIDVRSSPFSRQNPAFSKDELSRSLQRHQVRYVFMGQELGGQPADPTCYTNGRVDYQKCRTKPLYRRGIDRLRSAWQQGLCVALMCSEGKPWECHRAKLIGETLVEEGISVMHINQHGELMSHAEVIHMLTGGQLTLEGFDPLSTSRRR